MKVFRLFTILLGAFFVLSLGSMVASAAEKEKIATPNNEKIAIANTNSYEKLQLSNDILLQKALDGEIINNKHTKVTITDVEEGIKEIVIDKVLSEEILTNGEINSKNSTEKTILIIDPDLEKGDVQAAGEYPDTQGPPGSTVGMKINLVYDAKSLGGFSTRKLTSYSLTPLQYDRQWQMTYFEYQAVNWGTGWNSSGTMIVNSESTKLVPVTTVSYNTQYKGTTGFTKYTAINSDVIASSAVTGEFNYRRGTGAISTFRFNHGW